jgi:hypothetical protein
MQIDVTSLRRLMEEAETSPIDAEMVRLIAGPIKVARG